MLMLEAAIRRLRINHGRHSLLNPDHIGPPVIRHPHAPPTQARPVLPHRTIVNVPGYRRRRRCARVPELLWMAQTKMQPIRAHGQARRAAVIYPNRRPLPINMRTVSLLAEVFLRRLGPYLCLLWFHRTRRPSRDRQFSTCVILGNLHRYRRRLGRCHYLPAAVEVGLNAEEAPFMHGYFLLGS